MSARLSQDYQNQNQYQQQRPTTQSSSSYRMPQQYQQYSQNPNGGYISSNQQQSYYEPGEDQDEPFDVRADFDGAGPRWSERYGAGGLRDVEDKRWVGTFSMNQVLESVRRGPSGRQGAARSCISRGSWELTGVSTRSGYGRAAGNGSVS